ncbi:MAG TPA: response regulator [Nitrospirota bacterium]
MGEAGKRNSALSHERKKKLILVVDGDAAHLYYTGILLQRLDYTIHTVKTADDALEIMNVASPMLVLTETSLPGTNGLELLKRIKRSPRTAQVPVIVYSQFDNASMRDACMREGCAAFLQKPIVPEVLYAVIQGSVESRPRRYIRLSTCLSMIVGDEASGAKPREDNHITALSENGVFINTSSPGEVGTKLTLTIFLGEAAIRVEGVVLYSFKPGEGPSHEPGMGIKFSRISPGDQLFIREYIRKELTQELPVTGSGAEGASCRT